MLYGAKNKPTGRCQTRKEKITGASGTANPNAGAIVASRGRRAVLSGGGFAERECL